MSSHFPYGLEAPGQMISKTTTAATLPATGTKTIFTVANAGIIVDSIFGVVATTIQTQSCNLKVSAKVGSLTAVDVCANGAISALAVGTILIPITSFATALSVAATNGVVYASPGTPTSFIMSGPGIITITTSATNTGTISWYLQWRPLSNATPTVPGGTSYPPNTTVTPASS